MQIRQKRFYSFTSTTLLLTLARLTGAGVGFLSQFLIAHWLGTDQLGQFYFISSAIVVFGTVVSLGYGGIANRLVVRYLLRKDTRSLEGFSSQVWREPLIVTVFASAALVVLSYAAGVQMTTSSALFASIGIFGFSLLRINGGIANALKRFELAFLPDNFIRPILFLLCLALLIIPQGQPNVVGVIFCFCLAAVGVAIGQVAFLTHALRESDSSYDLKRAIISSQRARQADHWRASGRQLIASLLVGTLFADIVILTAGFVLTNEQLGLFGLSVKLAFLVGFIIQVAHQIATPAMAESLAQTDHDETKRHAIKANSLAVAASTVGLAVVMIFGRPLLSLFGNDFEAGYWTLVVAMLVQLIRALSGPAMPILIAAGRHADAQIAHFSAPVILIAFMFLLGANGGATGAALSVMITTSVTGIWLSMICLRKIGIGCDAFHARPNLQSLRGNRSLAK